MLNVTSVTRFLLVNFTGVLSKEGNTTTSIDILRMLLWTGTLRLRSGQIETLSVSHR